MKPTGPYLERTENGGVVFFRLRSTPLTWVIRLLPAFLVLAALSFFLLIPSKNPHFYAQLFDLTKSFLFDVFILFILGSTLVYIPLTALYMALGKDELSVSAKGVVLERSLGVVLSRIEISADQLTGVRIFYTVPSGRRSSLPVLELRGGGKKILFGATFVGKLEEAALGEISAVLTNAGLNTTR